MPARLMPLPNVALVDQRSGVMDQNWYDYFLKNAQDLTALQATVTVLQASVAALTPQLAKAWASVTVSGGTPTIQDSYNVASIVQILAGRFDITVITPFATANWVPIAISGRDAGGGELYSTVRQTALTASLAEFDFSDNAGIRTDPLSFYFVGFGNQ